MHPSKKRRVVATILGPPLALIIGAGIEVAMAVRAPKLPKTATMNLNQQPQNPTTRVVWLGDSTAAGVGVTDPAKALPEQVAALGTASVTTDLTVLAVSGAKVKDVLRKQLPQVAALNPDTIYISVGANDTTSVTSTKLFARRYQALLNSLPQGARVVVLGIPDMGSPTRIPQPMRAVAGFYGRALDDVVRRAAADHRAVYVDIRGQAGPEFRDQPEKYFAADKFHPSETGYSLWADAVFAAGSVT